TPSLTPNEPHRIIPLRLTGALHTQLMLTARRSDMSANAYLRLALEQKLESDPMFSEEIRAIAPINKKKTPRKETSLDNIKKELPGPTGKILRRRKPK